MHCTRAGPIVSRRFDITSLGKWFQIEFPTSTASRVPSRLCNSNICDVSCVCYLFKIKRIMEIILDSNLSSKCEQSTWKRHTEKNYRDLAAFTCLYMASIFKFLSKEKQYSLNISFAMASMFTRCIAGCLPK